MRKLLVVVFATFVAWGAFAQVTFTQTGMASFYADKFQGRSTASGERYDKNKLTCAHLSLPFGTTLRVTSLENNRSTVVRVNDRGPFAPDRIIDLSRKAAEALGIISAGTGKVKIEVIAGEGLFEASSPAPDANVANPSSSSSAKPAARQEPLAGSGSQAASLPPAPSTGAAVAEGGGEAAELYSVQVAPVAAKGFAVQLASYQGLSNLFRKIGGVDERNLLVYVVGSDSYATYKVMVGPFPTRAQAVKEKERLGNRFPGCFVVQL